MLFDFFLFIPLLMFIADGYIDATHFMCLRGLGHLLTLHRDKLVAVQAQMQHQIMCLPVRGQ